MRFQAGSQRLTRARVKFTREGGRRRWPGAGVTLVGPLFAAQTFPQGPEHRQQQPESQGRLHRTHTERWSADRLAPRRHVLGGGNIADAGLRELGMTPRAAMHPVVRGERHSTETLAREGSRVEDRIDRSSSATVLSHRDRGGSQTAAANTPTLTGWVRAADRGARAIGQAMGDGRHEGAFHNSASDPARDRPSAAGASRP